MAIATLSLPHIAPHLPLTSKQKSLLLSLDPLFSPSFLTFTLPLPPHFAFCQRQAFSEKEKNLGGHLTTGINKFPFFRLGFDWVEVESVFLDGWATNCERLKIVVWWLRLKLRVWIGLRLRVWIGKRVWVRWWKLLVEFKCVGGLRLRMCGWVEVDVESVRGLRLSVGVWATSVPHTVCGWLELVWGWECGREVECGWIWYWECVG